MRVAFAIAWLAAGAALDAALARPAAAKPEVCALLGAEDIRAVQGVELKERKASRESVGGLDFAQCFFTAKDFARSVSLTLISGPTPDGARRYWQETFLTRPETGRAAAAAPVGGRKKSPPRSIEGAGDEAFWTGDARAGVLYVLSGDAVLRISVGGVADEAERLRRSTALATVALKGLSGKR